MESLLNGLHRNDQTLETDSTIRLSKRPRGNSNLNPKAFEDFGSSLAPRSSQAPPKSKPKPRTTVSQKPTRIGIKKPLLDFCKSEDELDLLSSSQADSDNYQLSKKASVFKPRKYVDEKGKEHDYNPNFYDNSEVLSKLKFKKLGREDNVPSSSSLKKQPCFKDNTQDFGSWVNDLERKGVDNQVTREYLDDDDVLEITCPLRLKSSNQRLSPPRSTSKQPVQPKRPNALPARPKPRPLPRPVRKFNADAGSSRSNSVTIFVDCHELFPLGRTKTVAKTKYSSRSPSPEIYISTPDKKDGASSHPPSLPKNFPMDMMSPLGGEKVQQKPLPNPRNKVVTSQSKGKNKVRPFPLDEFDEDDADAESDSDKSKGRAKAKGKQKQTPSSPQNFPMDMISPLGAKKSLPKPRSKIKPPSFKAFLKEGPSEDQKRISNRSDDERQAKKRRCSGLLHSQDIFEDEGDSITISPDTDPRTLCPYCDTPLPSFPSPLLINILAATRKKSTRDPRPSNPLGLKAPLTNFIVVCQRHRFESQILPEAERKGWPKTIQWKKLGVRVERMKHELQALIEDPGGEREIGNDVDEDIDEVERLFRGDGDGTRQKGPKTRSIFWTEVMDEVKKKGSRAVVGVRGQFANFEKTQPGYYGEQGSVIIHQTLFDIFPPASFDPARISPLTSNEFVSRILVPEVALRLIMEDRDLEGDDGMYQALAVLRESSAYGVAMFPEDGGECSTGKKRRDDVMGVGDKIVMERARKRRKELEEEEEGEREEAKRMTEMDAGLEMEQVKVKKKMGDKNQKGKQKEKQLEQRERPRPRPRPIAKVSSSMNVQPPSDLEGSPQPQSSAPHKSPRNQRIIRAQSRTRNMYGGIDTDPSDGFSSRPAIDSSASESDIYYRPTSKGRKRSPFANELMLKQTKSKQRKPLSTRAASRDLGVLIIGSGSDASLGSRMRTKPTVRKSSRKNTIEKSDSKMDVDFYDGDEDDVNLEVGNFLDMKTPTGKYSRSSNHREDNSIDEETPKPPRTDVPNDRPLMIARMRQSQNDLSESKFREADIPPSRRTSKPRSDEPAPNLRAICVEDTTDTEVGSPNNYSWLLNDTSQSQSSMEGKSILRRY